MLLPKEGDTTLIADRIRSLTPRGLLGVVANTYDIHTLRRIAAIRFGAQAKMLSDNDKDPFIEWPAMNRRFEPWLAVAVGRVALAEFFNNKPPSQLLVITAPRSATPYSAPLIDHHVFPGALYPVVLKKNQFEQFGVSQDGARELPVHSYVHNRQPNGDRGTESMYFFETNVYTGATVVCIDDAVAHAITLTEIAGFAKKELGVSQFFAVSPMAKVMQGGIDLLTTNPHVNGVSIMIRVLETQGTKGPITYSVNGEVLTTQAYSG